MPGSHNDGTRRSARSACGRPARAANSPPPPGGAGRRQRRLEVGGEVGEGSGSSARQRADNQRGRWGQIRQEWPDEVPKPSADLIADHRVADSFGYDEADARRGGLRRLVEKKMNDQGAAASPAATANRCGEVVATPQSLCRGQHDYLGIPGSDRYRLRPTACRDPCRGGWQGWRGRPGCACAAGIRGSSRAGGCSAGRCACSRHNSVLGLRPGGISGCKTQL
jgi:hypothetical protein